MALKKYKLPYGKEYLEFSVEESHVRQVMLPNKVEPLSKPVEAIKEVLRNPIGSPPLKEVVKSGESVAIIVNDITRLTKSDVFLPLIVDELNLAGVNDDDIKIVFSTGTHQEQTFEEQETIVGKKLAKRIKMYDHKCDEDENHVLVGTTSRGNKVLVNKIVAEADHIILTGGVILHLLAGYGGGRKAILPGVCHRSTIDYNHKFMFDPNSTDGQLKGNPCHEDMYEACSFVNPSFLLNVVLDENKDIVGVVGGHWEKAHKEGCKIVDKLYKVKLEEKVDIVVASCGGFPKDIEFRQAHKGQENAYKVIKEGGMVIFAAQCTYLHGDASFYEWMLKYPSHVEMEEELKRKYQVGPHKAYWVAKLASIAKTHLLSDMPYDMVENLMMVPIKSIEDALKIGYRKYGDNPSICIMPYASYTLPVVD
ncbi:MAG: nickel-dependent lactate racemase [Peptococcales bacterium]|jgi:nickel-dependent lactate racemase